MLKSRKQLNRGATTISIAVLMLSVLGTAAGITLLAADRSLITSVLFEKDVVGVLLAEAAVEDAMAHLDDEDDWDSVQLPAYSYTEPRSLGAGTIWSDVKNDLEDPGGSLDTNGLLLVKGYGRVTASGKVFSVEVLYWRPDFRIPPVGAVVMCGEDEISTTSSFVEISGYDHYIPGAPCFEDGCLPVQKGVGEAPATDEDESKVDVCHIPPGNPEEANTINIAQPAVPAHLNHGDYLGECAEDSGGDDDDDDDDHGGGDDDDDDHGGGDDDDDDHGGGDDDDDDHGGGDDDDDDHGGGDDDDDDHGGGDDDDDDDSKVDVCHIPPGNPSNAHTINVSTSAVSAHLDHGDYLGECEEDDEYSWECPPGGPGPVDSGSSGDDDDDDHGGGHGDDDDDDDDHGDDDDDDHGGGHGDDDDDDDDDHGGGHGDDDDDDDDSGDDEAIVNVAGVVFEIPGEESGADLPINLSGEPAVSSGDCELQGPAGMCSRFRFLSKNVYRLVGVETLSEWPDTGNGAYGSACDTKLLHVAADTTLEISGYAQSGGVLLVDGKLKITGTFTWTGAIILGPGAELEITGTANIYGAVVSAGDGDKKAKIDLGGTTNIVWSSDAVLIGPSTMPGLMNSWREFKK